MRLKAPFWKTVDGAARKHPLKDAAAKYKIKNTQARD